MEEFLTIPKEALENFILKLNQIDSLSSKIEIIEKSIGLTQEAKAKKEKAIRVSRKLFEKYRDQLEANIRDSNGQYELTKCGLVPAPIGFGNEPHSKSISFEYVANYPNYTSGFGGLFGLILDDPNALVVTLQMMNDVLYTCTQAATWYTTGAWPEWNQDVIKYNGGYMKGFTVMYNGVLYKSLVDKNVALPVSGSLLDFVNWIISPLEFPTNSIIYTSSSKQKNGFIIANGANLSKIDYRNLWLTAQHDGVVTDLNTWQNRQYYGLFADIDANTFRIPDLRGFYLRTANQGSGHDPRRGNEVGNYKMGLVLNHNHSADASQDGHTHEDQGHQHVYSYPNENLGGGGSHACGNGRDVNTSVGYARLNWKQPAVHVSVGNNNNNSSENSVNDIAYIAQLKY